jgi:hypothetical protein
MTYTDRRKENADKTSEVTVFMGGMIWAYATVAAVVAFFKWVW